MERFGRYTRTLNAGLNIVVPFIDTIRNRIDLREQVVPFPPQPVITQDNLVVNIDTVIYYQVTDARAATYEVASYIQAIEQLTVTTLRNIIGGMDLERTLTSREEINAALRGVLDEATGKWGIRVNRVELKAIEPPTSIQDSMEKQMRADRDKRAAILTAEGTRQAAILTAEGEKQSQILRAEGEAKAAALRAEGEAQAVRTVFEAIHAGDPDQKLLSYQYLQMLPKIAEGDANKLWIVPSEIGDASRDSPARWATSALWEAVRAATGHRATAEPALSAARSRRSTEARTLRRFPSEPLGKRGEVLVPQGQQHGIGGSRLERLPQEGHPRLLRSPVRLAVIVLRTGGHRVQPRVLPACDRGSTWSTVVALRPQYAHRCRSRTRTPRLDHGACLRNGTRTYLHSLITRGAGMSTSAPRMRSSGWDCSTTALSCRTSTTARFNVTVDSGSKLAFSTSVSRIQPTSRVHLPTPRRARINSVRARRDGQRNKKVPAPDHFQDQRRANVQ